MSQDMMTTNEFLDLSDEQQQLLSGGQNLVTTGSPAIAPLGRALTDGSELVLAANNLRGTTNSGPAGSLGNSLGNGSATKTGAQDSMILPPFIASTEVLS